MKKSLIALESEIISRQLQEQLSGLHCVLTCHNGLDAAEILMEQNPDVLVLDLRLPGIDGVTLLRAARDSGMGTQVIAMTDYLSDHIARALEQAGPGDVIVVSGGTENKDERAFVRAFVHRRELRRGRTLPVEP